MFPPNVPGGITACAAAPAGQTPIVPKNGSTGIAMSSRRNAYLPSVRSKMRRYASGKSSGRRPAPGMIAVQPQSARPQVEDLDRERVAGLRAFHRDRPGERVHALPVERRDDVRRRLGRDLVVADVARLERDRVAARDRQHRLVACVPLEVDAVGGNACVVGISRHATPNLTAPAGGRTIHVATPEKEVRMSWKIKGSYVETCSCELMCPCNMSFDHGATYDYCRVTLVFNIREGEIDGTDVSGLKAAVIADTPKVMTEGNWKLGMFIDENATDEQADKLGAVFGGQMGGPMAALGAAGRRGARRRACADRGRSTTA